MLKKLAMGLGIAAMCWISTGQADAQRWDKKTTVTFDRPVELPTMVLPAGTYVFRLLDIASERHVVQVFNKEENHIYTTILAIPNYRLQSTSDTVMKFGEATRDNPEPLRAWFYPADNFGQEFVYPKKRAIELATTTKVPVLATPAPKTEKPEELVKEPVIAVTPEQKEVEVAQVTAPPTPPPPPKVIAQATPPPVPVPAELPETASPIPALIVVAFGALGLAGVVRFVTKFVA